MKIDKWIHRIDEFGAWALLFLVLSFVMTGFGMTKHIMDPVLANYIHTRLLPLPLFFLFIVHLIRPVQKQFKNWNVFKKETTVSIYVYLLALIFMAAFAFLFLR
jgi:hypothetical protein